MLYSTHHRGQAIVSADDEDWTPLAGVALLAMRSRGYINGRAYQLAVTVVG